VGTGINLRGGKNGPHFWEGGKLTEPDSSCGKSHIILNKGKGTILQQEREEHRLYQREDLNPGGREHTHFTHTLREGEIQGYFRKKKGGKEGGGPTGLAFKCLGERGEKIFR